MLRLKDNDVNPGGMSPQLLLALLIAEQVFGEHGHKCVVTSLNDAVHGRTSLHYRGDAADLRTKHMPDVAMKEQVRREIKRRLNKHWDVLLEDLGGVNEHLHIEYQPRGY